MNAWICAPLTTDHAPARVSIKSGISVTSEIHADLMFLELKISVTFVTFF